VVNGSPLTPDRARATAARIADDLLFPGAMDVDRARRVPASHLDLLAAEGLYGVAAPPEVGGLGARDAAIAADLVQTLAGGCLTTAFVWIQHHGLVRATADSQQAGVRDRWLAPLARGEVRAGVGFAGVRGGASGSVVRRTGTGFVLDGEVPWITGWDMVDVVHVAAVDEANVVHFLIVDAVASDTLEVTPVELVAVRASGTVTVRFVGHEVPADRLTGTKALDEWRRDEASGSALNGFLALGVVDRCLRLLGPSPVADGLGGDLAACRSALLRGEPATIPDARAAASELAIRAAATLTVHHGSRSVRTDEHPQRLFREAGFLLVFGTRPAIRSALLARLGA
jgi:alkylation response protein AidB-like acyl-CoA dehydrogenase